MYTKRRIIIDSVLGGLLFVLLTWAIFSILQGSIFFDLLTRNPDNLKNYLLESGWIGQAAFFATVIVETVIAFIPGWFIYPVGGAIYGFFQAVAMIMAANFVAATICFWVGRRWGQRLIKKMINPNVRLKFEKYMQHSGAWSIFLLKLNPLTAFDIWSYVAGASSLNFWKFSFANLAGLAPSIFLTVYLGKELFDFDPRFFGTMVLILVVYLGWFFVRLTTKK